MAVALYSFTHARAVWRVHAKNQPITLLLCTPKTLLYACHAGSGQGAATQQAAAPLGSSKEDVQQEASSSDNDASQPDMDLQKALKIVSKHYVSRNITWITYSLMSPVLYKQSALNIMPAGT